MKIRTRILLIILSLGLIFAAIKYGQRGLPVYYVSDFIGAGPGGDTLSAINAAITAANAAGPAGGIVHFGSGVWSVRCSFVWGSVYQPRGIQMKSNVILEGDGIGITIIRCANPDPASTFNISNFITNSHWDNIINCKKISNFQIRNLSINGARTFQKNYNPNPYLTPQPNLGDTVMTNAIFIDSCAATANVINVGIDSAIADGIYNHTTPFSTVDMCIITNSLVRGMQWQGTNGIGLNTIGSVLSNSIIRYSGADNVGSNFGYGLSIINNDISWSQHTVDSVHGNSAGIYIANFTANPNWAPIFISGNSIHDNSAVGIDLDDQDTTFFNFNGSPIVIRNNKIYRNAGLGSTCRFPNVSYYGNTFTANGTDSLGFHDNVGGGFSAINLKVPNAQGVAIDGNLFVDTTGNKWALTIGAGGTLKFMRFTNNIIRGFSFVYKGSILAATAPFNTVFGNTWEDNGGIVHQDFTLDANGTFYIQPQLMNAVSNTGSGAVVIADGSVNTTVFGYHKNATANAMLIEDVGWTGGDMYHGGTAATLMGIQMGSSCVSGDCYTESNSGTTAGRSIAFIDVNAGNIGRMGIGPSGAVYFGKESTTPGTTWDVKINPPGTTTEPFVKMAGTINGSTGVYGVYEQWTGSGAGGSFNYGHRVDLAAGNTGNQNAALLGVNSSVSTSTSLSSIGTLAGTTGSEGGGNGSASGLNVGIVGYGASGNKNVGLYGDATTSQFNNAAGVSVGVIAFALRANASAIEVGAYFGLQTGTPTLESAVIVLDNGSEAVPVARLRVNGTTKAQFDANAKYIGVASTTVTATLNVPEGTAPTTPAANDMWSQTSDHNLYFQANSATHIIPKTLTATGTLDFASTNAQLSADLTITVTGAATGDVVMLGVPNASVNANTDFTAWVSSTNTVTVRFNNYSAAASDPASGTFRVAVIKY